MDKFDMMHSAAAIAKELRHQLTDFSATEIRLERDAAALTASLLDHLNYLLENDVQPG
jgi:hypothetical protein